MIRTFHHDRLCLQHTDPCGARASAGVGAKAGAGLWAGLGLGLGLVGVVV